MKAKVRTRSATATESSLNRLMEGSGYYVMKCSAPEVPDVYVLHDPRRQEIVRSRKLSNLYMFVESIIEEHKAMSLAGKTFDIRSAIRPMRQVKFTSPDDNATKTYHILAIVEWNRVVVKYWNLNDFIYEVIPMKSFVEWYIMGRLG